MSQQQIAAQRSLKRRNQFRRNLPLYLMLLLPVLLLFIYNYIPMAGIVIAFQKFLPAKGVLGSKWVGLQNFKTLFGMPGFGRALRNTLTLSVWKIVLGVAVPVAFTLLLNTLVERFQTHGADHDLPAPLHFLGAAGGHFCQAAGRQRSGQQAARGTGRQKHHIFGRQQVVYLHPDLYPHLEGIRLWHHRLSGGGHRRKRGSVRGHVHDGAGHWKQMLHVTLPAIVPTIILMTALAIGNIMSAGFDQVFNMYNEVVYESGDILDTLVYRMGFGAGGQFSFPPPPGCSSPSFPARWSSCPTGWPTKPADTAFSKGGRSSWLKPLQLSAPRKRMTTHCGNADLLLGPEISAA